MENKSKFINNRYIREKERAAMTGISRTTVWRMEKAGTFPKRVKLSERLIGYLLSDVTDWMECRASGQEWSDIRV
ncbi:helix-turn-helix transcriptional regulator [Vibrio astriarenae]